MELETFLRAELGSLLRFARVLTGDRGTAEDIVSDVVTRLYSTPDLFASIDNPAGYLRRMITNRYVSWGRTWFRITPRASIEPARPATDPADLVGDRDELRAALSTLPRKQKAVLVLRYYAELGDDEIGELLECSTSTVRSHASRALAALRMSIPAERSSHDPAN